MIIAMMDSYPGELEALTLLGLAVVGLIVGGLLAIGFLLISIFVRRDESPGVIKAWAIAALLIFIINVFVYSWLIGLGRDNLVRDGEQRPLITPPPVLFVSMSLINSLGPSVSVLSPIVVFWVKHPPRSRHSPSDL
ncbi:hypothetical protein [Limnothrix sp. FACHB-708]|uniref:hypothetical protein n=1 Tax=Limnothrix sp. FACHB-708 TaxID=2692818 RepID=UPI001689E013|nr:hypothetical protein [Limnothrix sp. FACHB-708]MBD2589401.1 hypothetical protein [Limnothrix sp. FACHB-406]